MTTYEIEQQIAQINASLKIQYSFAQAGGTLTEEITATWAQMREQREALQDQLDSMTTVKVTPASSLKSRADYWKRYKVDGKETLADFANEDTERTQQTVSWWAD